MKALFIVNPVAGKGITLKKAQAIKDVMVSINEIDYEVVYTEKPGHAMEIAKNGAAHGYDIVFAVGGDGTVNEVANGLIGTESSLGVIPGGSGNDFVRSLGISGDLENILIGTLGGIKKQVDAGVINGRYFVNISSVGFDADVVLATQKAKKYFLSGSTAYIAGLISAIFKRKTDKVRMVIDKGSIEEKVLLVAVANGNYYGGGMKAAPDAVLDDGLFDICFIKSMSKAKMLFLFPQFMKGNHKKFKEVSFYKSQKVFIESAHPISINVDGEVFKGTKVGFELIRNVLTVAMPIPKQAE